MERLNSISAVVLTDLGTLDARLLHDFNAALGSYCVDVETIIVAGNVDDRELLALKQLIADVPDCTCYVLAEEIDAGAAGLFGIEAAVGDYVLLLNANALAAIVPALPMTIGALNEGFEVVTPLPKGSEGRAVPISAIDRLAYSLLSKLAGLTISRIPSDLIALSRDAALHILSKPNAELMLKARTAGRGFPAFEIPAAYSRPALAENRRPFARRAGKAVSLLISIGVVPVRVVSIVSLTSSILSILYAVYVVATYFLNPQVVAGWTTLSLQIAGMMFLFSVTFALLSEYIVLIYSVVAVRKRRQAVRELRSEITARSDRLNIIDEIGVYRFGAPQAANARERPS